MNNNLLNHYKTKLNNLESNGMLRNIPHIQGEGKYIIENNNKYLNLSSNDYLGVFEEAGIRADFLKEIGSINSHFPLLGAASSRLLTGNSNSYIELENLLAKKFNKESALIFNSGYHTNNGILPALTDKNSLIIADKLVHASIIDGIKLSECKFERFRHNDINHLSKIIEKEHNNYSTIFIVTEGIFSMRGDRALLKEIVELKNKYDNILIYLDEAHSFGVLGKNGLGLAEELDLLDSIDLYVATFGKAISSVGAFTVCNKIIRSYLINKMRPLIFSTTLPSINIEWSKYIISRLDSFNANRERIKKYSKRIEEALGIDGNNGSQILTYTTGDPKNALDLSERLKAKGIYALPIRPPTVPEGESGIRISLTASLNDSDIEKIIKAFKG